MISTFFIERPVFANVIALTTVVVGLICFFILPVAQYPPIVPPTVQVSTRFPGASADVIAATIGVPIEQAVNGIENSLYMQSTSSSDGTYTLTVTFEVGTDLNKVLPLVQNLVNTAQPQLPESVRPQGVTVRKVSTDILLVIGLYSDTDQFDETYLSNYAVINMQNPLARLPGVGQVVVRGAGPYSMRIWLDPERLYHHNLTTLDVINAVQRQNLQVAAGQLGAPPTGDGQVLQLTVNALGRLTDVAQFEDIIVKKARDQSAQLVRVRDVARVELSRQSYANFARTSAHKSALIPIFTLPGANALDVADSVRAAVASMAKQFPQGLRYSIHYDTTRFVRQAINEVYRTLFEAGALVLVVILVFLQNWRAMLVPATTVPVTIIGTFAAMAALGFGINLMTLFALILAIGIVVDDAIIIVESASYYIETGLTPKEATMKAMSEITGPIIGITLVLAAVFLPAAFLPGITGQLFRQFALVIAATALVSAINALTLKPTQCAVWLRTHDQRRDDDRNAFYRAFNRAFAATERAYICVVERMVERAQLMTLVFGVVVTGAMVLYAMLPTGFLPAEDQGYAVVITKLPEGASQPRTLAATQQVDDIIRKTPGIAAWVTIGGFSVIDNANLPNTATTFIVYKDWHERGDDLDQDHVLGRLRQELATRIDAAQTLVVVPPPIRGLGTSGGFQLMLEDRQNIGSTELQNAAAEVTRVANTQSGLNRVVNTFSARSPQIYLDIDRVKTESLDVSVADVFQTVQGYLGSVFVNLFNKYNQVFQVYVQAEGGYRRNPDDIAKLYVRSATGDMVPLGTLLQSKRALGPEVITRYNLYPAAQIIGNAAPGFSSGEAIQLMEQVLRANLPPGFGYDWTASSFQEKRVGKQALIIYSLSILLAYMVLAALYESWSAPLAVIIVVPLALVGVVAGLYLKSMDANLYTQVGLVLMIALASKNAILVVEYARLLQEQGKDLRTAAIEATRRRFRPIIMTSFAFILGVVPLVFAGGAGAASLQSIGTVVFGGMLASTLLAIPFVPVLYVVIEGLARRRVANTPAV